jgi:hypothetical protein
MNYKNKKKLSYFLNEKLRKINDETQDNKHKLNLSYIKTEKGFEVSHIERYRGFGYGFFNSSDCQCFIYYEGKQRRKIISIAVDGISSSNGLYGTDGTLYRCMDEIDEIAKEFRQLKSDLEKQEKINEISQNGIKTWLKTIMQNQSYTYYSTESDNKITLSIQLKNRLQLDIPIYFRNFQKIMPDLLNTIQQFEKTVNESKIKVLISNSKPNQQWKTS